MVNRGNQFFHQMKVRFKKTIRILVFLFGSLFLIVLLLNSFDSSLNEGTQRILESDLTSTQTQRKSCAALLGLFASENLDFLAEGFKLLEAIDALGTGRALSPEEDIAVPHYNSEFSIKETCKGICKLNKKDRNHLITELKGQKYLLDRYKSLMKLNGNQCNNPVALFKKPILGLYLLTRYQIIEYNIWMNEGRHQEVANGLFEMNHYFQGALESPKYTLVASLIYVASIQLIRNAIISLTQQVPSFKLSLQTASQTEWLNFNYEDLILKIEKGELQGGHALMRYSFNSKFEIQQINPFMNWLRNYFYLRNNTLNENYEAIQRAKWHPCLGQTDISCDSQQSSNPFLWLRNPVGKIITSTITSDLSTNFKKLKKRLNEMPHFEKL